MNEEINNWREDQVQGMISQEEALSGPVKDGTYFKLPKVFRLKLTILFKAAVKFSAMICIVLQYDAFL